MFSDIIICLLELINILNDMRVGKITDSTLEVIRSLGKPPEYPDDGILPTEL